MAAEADLATALMAQLEALAGSLDPQVPVAWPGVPFVPTPGVPHLRVAILPAEPSVVTLGPAGYSRLRGLLQVDVCWPEGQGEVKPRQLADAVCASFKPGIQLVSGATTVRVLGRSHIAAALGEAPWYRLIVRVPYQADVPH